MAKSCPTPRPFRSVVGTVVFLTLLFFLGFVTRFIFAPLLPAIKDDIALTSGQAGSLFLIGAIGMVVGSLSAGFISARFTHRGSMFIGTFGAAAVLVAAYFAGTVWYLRAVLIILGFFAGMMGPSLIATITAIVRPQDWGKALSVQQLGPPLGLVGSGLFAAALLSWFSWQTSLLWMAGLCIILGLAFFAFRGVGYFPGDPLNGRMVRPVVTLHSFWVLIFLFACGMGAQVGLFSILPLYLTQERGMTTGSANTFLGLANIAPLAMVFISGWLTDRIGEKRAIAFHLFIAGIAVMCAGLFSGIAMQVSIVVIAAFSVGFFPPAFKALSHIVQPTYRSIAAALTTPAAFIFGGGLLPIALGYMGDNYSFASGLLITGAVVTVGSGAAFLITVVEQMEEGC